MEPTPLKRALVAVQDLTARLEASERARRAPIAIVGMACRLPGGAVDPGRFWQLLRDGNDAVGTVPTDRWDAHAFYDADPDAPGKMYTAAGGFLAEPVDRFDADFFGIAPREAIGIDPQHRLLLELSWEALEHAGIAPDSIRGARAGVFVGISGNDYATRRLLAGATRTTDAYAATGGAFSVAAGRISYLLGLQGPSFALDAACSSSLVAVSLAVQSLRDGSSDLAIVGGVNLMLAPETTVAMCKLRALSPTGRCRSFAASADGYVRGEGGGVLVLKRLADAHASGDRIHAIIRGIAVNHDGRSSGLTVPNASAQQAVIRAALEDAGITPDRVEYLEAMGTGTVLGDAIEMGAIDATYGRNRDPSRPLRLGSVKTNIGHLEAASGMASMIKLVLALDHQEIPAHLHLDEPSGHVDWQTLPIAITTRSTPWKRSEQPRVGAVSSFGFSGTNAHVVIEEAPPSAPAVPHGEEESHLLPLSAHSPEALRDLASAFDAFLASTTDTEGDICFTASAGRAQLAYRLAIVGRSASDLREGLQSFLLGQPHPRVFTGRASGTPPGIAFLFTDGGSAHPGMGRELYVNEPAFRAVIDECDSACEEIFGSRLIPVLYPDLATEFVPLPEGVVGPPLNAALFAVQSATAALWRSCGIDPRAFIGEGNGKVAAEFASGALGLREGLREMAKRTASGSPPVSLAVGGDTRELEVSTVRPRALAAGSAGDTAVSCYEAESSLPAFSPGPTALSTATHETVRSATDDGGGAYPRDSSASSEVQSCSVVLEIGPKVEAGRLSVRSDRRLVASLSPDGNDGESFLMAAASLYVAGTQLNWKSVGGGPQRRRRVALPTYPFQRERFWPEEVAALETARVDRPHIGASGSILDGEGSSDLRLPLRGEGCRPDQFLEYLQGRLLRVLGSRSGRSPDPIRPLAEFGIDSLMVLELRNAVLRDLGVDLPHREIFESTLTTLSERLSMEWERGVESVAPPLVRVNREMPLPLSFGQLRLWLLNELDPDSTAYRIVVTVELRGPLQSAALELALGEMQRRHEVLRTTFAAGENGITQVVQRPQPFSITLEDLSGVAASDRESEIERVSRAEALAPFDLGSGPLMRALLLRRGETDHRLILSLHHIISDGWSVRVLLRELSALYQAMLDGVPSPLPELAVQYADYSVWQRQHLDVGTLRPQLDYWKTQLAKLPILELPTDRPRPAVQTHSSATVSVVLDEQLSAELRRFSQAHGATLFMTLLAGFQLLLSRLSGQEDFAVGSPIASRGRAELEGLIGFFMNTLVLRSDLSGDPSFSALVHRVREVTLGAYANQDVPFERLVEELSPARDLSRTPLVQVLFNMLPVNRGEEPLRLGDAEARVTSDLNVDAKFDLTLYVHPGERLQLDLLYNPDLYDKARVTELLRQYELLLSQVIARPEVAVSRHSLVTESARRLLPNPQARLEFEWHDSITARVASWATSTPDRIAVRDARESWSYAELHEASGALAGRLSAAGVGRGDVVAVLASRDGLLPVSLLGVMRAGAAFLILDPAHPADRLAMCLSQARAKVFMDLGERTIDDPGLDEALGALAARIRLPSVKADFLSTMPGPEVDVQLNPDDTAYIAFTSGTTGVPNGIVGGHAPLSHFLEWHARTFALSADDRFSVLSGLSHDPLLRDLFAPLWVGATACIVDSPVRAEPGELLEWMRREAITVAHLTPAMGEVLAAGADGTIYSDVALPALRLACFGGDVLSSRHVRALRGVAPRARCVNFYGTTETPQAMSFAVAEPDAPGPPPLGKGIADTQLLVLTRGNVQAGVGELGEICVRTPYLAKGYLSEEGLTQPGFVVSPISNDATDRMYRTGDMGRYLPDGTVAFAGRRDDQVKIRGYRVDPREIEAVLASRPGVARCAVVAADDGAGSPILVACVVPIDAPSAELGSSLQRALRAALPPHMVPSRIAFADALPLTPSGKVDRAAIIASAPAITLAERAAVDARSQVEEIIASVWQDLLGIERIHVHESFYDLGGHSLLAMQVVSRLRAALQVDLPLRALFEAPTIAGLAERIATCRYPDSQLDEVPLVPSDRATPLPLSFAQERLWVLHQMDPESTAYNLHGHVRIRGSLDVTALRSAFDHVMQRQESLRTVFREVDGSPVQVILDPTPFPLELVDLCGAESEARESELDSVRRLACRFTFDLAAGPLCRAWLVRVGEAEHELLLTLHHIVTDGWSLRVMMRELHALYGSYSRGAAPHLPDLTIQYGDYASWQRRWLGGSRLESQLSYWRERLADLPMLSLPLDLPRPALQTYAGSVETLELPAELSEGIRRLAREESSTLFMTLLSAFKLLLSRLSGQEEIVVGTPIAGRTRPEIEPLIGYFLNNLVLRTDLSGDPSIRGLLRRVRDTTLGAYAHQDVPFERLVEELQPDRDLSRTPLFQVLFNMLPDFTAEHLELGEAVVEVVGGKEADARFDLTLYVSDGDTISLRLVCNRDLFERSTARRMLEHLQVLLMEMVRDPERRLSTVPLLTADRRRDLASRSEPVELMVPFVPFPVRAVEGSIPARFAHQVRSRPDAVAVDDGRERWTYAELDLRRRRVAAGVLTALGEGEGRVALCFEHGASMIAAMLGVLTAGKTYVPLDPHHPAERLRYMADEAGAAAVLCDPFNLDSVRKWIGDVPVLNAGELMERGAELGTNVDIPADSIAYILFTSGTTGEPKGVVQSHSNVLHHIRTYANRLHIGGQDRLSLLAGYGFDAAVMDIFGALLTGAAVCPIDMRGDAAFDLGGVLRERGVTVYHSTPTVFRHLIGTAEGVDLSGIRLVVLGGEEASHRDVESFRRHFAREAVFVNGLGPSECTLALQFLTKAHDRLSGGLVPVGKAVEGVDISVLNDAGEPVEDYATGEIVIRSAYLALGYWRRPDETAAVFRPDPDGGNRKVFRTGDLGRTLPDGSIVFAGRKDGQVKVRGIRIETAEVESCLLRAEGIREAAVIVRKDEVGEQRLTAYVVRDPDIGDQPTGPLRAHLTRYLPAYMVPSDILPVERLPLTPNGKLDRRALVKLDILPPAPSERLIVRPSSPMELLIARLWRELLSAESITVDDNFYDLGGHSLLAVRFVSRFRDETGRRLDLRELTYQTLGQLAAVHEGPPGPRSASGLTGLLRRLVGASVKTATTAAP